MGILARFKGGAKRLPLLVTIVHKISGAHVHNSKPFIDAVRQKHGLEIGGPSEEVFGDTGTLALYRHIGGLDNAVYSASTPFSNDPRGFDFQFHPRKPAGRNLILESSALTDVKDGTYDFVLSSHCAWSTAPTPSKRSGSGSELCIQAERSFL